MKSALPTSPLMSLLHVMSCLPRSHPQHYVCVLPGLASPDSLLFLCSLTAEDEIKDGVRTSRGKQLHTPRWLHAQSPLLQQVIILLLSRIHGPIAHLLHNRLIAELHWLYDTCRGDLFEINFLLLFFFSLRVAVLSRDLATRHGLLCHVACSVATETPAKKNLSWQQLSMVLERTRQ